MTIKHRLIVSLLPIFFLYMLVVIYGFPFLGSFFELGLYQQMALLFVVLGGFTVLISLTIDVILNLPLKTFLKNLSDAWKKNHISLHPSSTTPAELLLIAHALDDILAESSAHTQSLQSKAGLSEGHSQIITIVAHQMRTPISGLKWVLAGMLDGAHTKEEAHILREAVEATDRIADIVEELLRGIGLEQDLAKEHRTSVDMIKLVNTVIIETSLIARSNTVSLVLEKDEVIPLVEGNEQELRFAVHTLVSNAVHYSPSGGTVTLTLRSDKEHVRLDVKDHGIGIGKGEQAMIFTKFGRSKESISKYPNGTGLSLYLSKSIIINHKGELTYVSEERKGSTFTIILPVRGKGELETFIRS